MPRDGARCRVNRPRVRSPFAVIADQCRCVASLITVVQIGPGFELALTRYATRRDRERVVGEQLVVDTRRGRVAAVSVPYFHVPSVGMVKMSCWRRSISSSSRSKASARLDVPAGDDPSGLSRRAVSLPGHDEVERNPPQISTSVRSRQQERPLADDRLQVTSSLGTALASAPHRRGGFTAGRGRLQWRGIGVDPR